MTTFEGGPIAKGITAVVPDDDPNRPRAIEWDTYETTILAEWIQLLNQDPEEAQVQSFLELHPAMVPGGSGDIGPGGHHGSEMSAVFRRPKLIGAGRTFEPDFMWVTRSSGLITPILIEIEKPGKRWFQQNGRPTAEFRDAHDQLNDWRSWFSYEENSALFRRKYLLFDRFDDRPLVSQFVLIYGRRSEFEEGGGHANPDELRRKRDSQRAADETFMTFDAVRPRFDHRNSMTVTMTAEGPKPFALSPIYGTGTHTGPKALLLGSLADALERSVMMTDRRKRYIAQRWDHWAQFELEVRKNPGGGTRARRTGVE